MLFAYYLLLFNVSFSANYSLCGFQGALVGSSGLEPPTSRLSGVRSNLLSYEPVSGLRPALPPRSRSRSLEFGGDERVRTDDPLLAKQVLSQLSYTPTVSRPSSFLLALNVSLSSTLKTIQYFISLPPLRLDPPRSCAVIAPILFLVLPRKEVIQPHLPIRLPCYDFTPVIGLTFDSSLLTVRILASGAPNSHGVTGGVYKARERIHRGMLIRDY